MGKYTMINKETCIACGSCGALASDVFDNDEYGFAFCKLDQNSGSVPIADHLLEDVIEAQECCPSESILLADEPFQQLVNG
ncbi:MAG TPA: ferredoxin [Ureibacillus sp.]|nr:ferredoxin [Ureibacillus sp.]